jgi:hypothetical protein
VEETQTQTLNLYESVDVKMMELIKLAHIKVANLSSLNAAVKVASG